MKKYLILLILILTACTSTPQYPTIQEKLSQMTSYQTNAEITYISNKGSTTYNTTISALSDGKYRIDITSPEDYNGNVVLYDGKLVWQYNPHLENNKICANPPEKASRREIILFSFLENYNTTMETTAVSATAIPQTILEAPLKSTNPIFAKEKLFIDNEKMLPQKLIIYDSENKERIVVKFSNFEYNKKLDDTIFKIS